MNNSTSFGAVHSPLSDSRSPMSHDETIGPKSHVFHTSAHNHSLKNKEDPSGIEWGSVPPEASFDPIGPSSSSYSVQYE